MPELPPRPKSSTAVKQELIRRDIDEKWKRTMMTPTGVKIIRIQPSLNYDSLQKYQYRYDTQNSPRSSSTPLKTPPSSRGTTNSRAQSASPMRSTGTQSSVNTGTARPGEVIEKPPAPQRPSSSRSSSSTTFNSRSRSCQPTHLYMKDSLRRAARANRPSSHVHSCSQTHAINEYAKQPRSPRRFDGTVVNLPKFVQGNEFLTHEDLSMGQKQYIWGIARVYSMSNLKELKQRQYQSILDHDFNRNMVFNKFNEQERLREWREYQRYSRFIRTHEQRIPRAGKEKPNSSSPCQEVSHIHRHVVKGWTTNPHSDEAYRSKRTPRRDYDEEREAVRRLPDDDDDDDTQSSGEYKIIISKIQDIESDTQTDNKQQSRDSKPAADANDDTHVHSDDHTDQNTDNAEEFADQVQQRSKPDEPLQSNESTEDSTEHAQMSKRADKVAELEDSNYL